MISELKEHLIPKINGSRGVNLKEKVFLGNLLPFLTHFMPEKRKCFLVETNHRFWPFTGGKYLQLVWELDDIKEVKDNFLCTFENIKVPEEILWIHKYYETNQFLRFDDPRENKEISCFYENSNEAFEQRKGFVEKNFGEGSYKTKSVKLMVGQVPTGKKRIVPFRITFTRNWQNSEDEFLGGILQVRFFHQVREVGALKGEFVEGNEDDEHPEKVLKEISPDEFEEEFN